MSRLELNNVLTKPVTIHDIKRIIKNFKNKAPGKLGINKMILINIPESAYAQYAQIINHTLALGYFPIIFKEGVLILILKPGKDPTLITSYRPITLLEVPGKMLETIINERVQRFAEVNNKFHTNQYGFKKGRGTEAALIRLYETVALNRRNGSQCNIVCRDIEKAFDKVWHESIKFKIMNLELPSILEKITCSFLDDRTAKIKYKDTSSEINVLSGVPQGSALSPTLFILYTSDVPPAGPGCTDILFADDVTQIVEYHHASKNFLARRTEREIKRINEFEKNGR